MTQEEIDAVKMISKSLKGTSIALVYLIADLSPIIGYNERDRLLKIIEDACEDACTGDNNEQEQGHKDSSSSN